ncbi:YtxH domain-containing protein [Paenibacillus harenae]|uniref:Gas vesicle protein n=1 Tax=Paenibacillus harenae TaxID=306543 RepID=A0ABT9TXK7_PAEHA|nr:YtxH domain-containing protein [Paenibacillus harenae]MDQ0060370.1 gas vesicle protein [Paenibacillus harenae]MDQ0112096.1 gas vesicle protein [Paenibacillus harenae]
MAKMNASSGVLIGSLVGGAIGVVSALLYAPKSGAQTREALAGKLQAVKEKSKNLAAVAGSHTKSIGKSVADEASDLAGHAKQSGANIVGSIHSAKEEVGHAMNANGR